MYVHKGIEKDELKLEIKCRTDAEHGQGAEGPKRIGKNMSQGT